MTGSQLSMDADLILHLTETNQNFECEDNNLGITSAYTCEQRTSVRPTETAGEWWHLEPRRVNASNIFPTRAYHTAASLPSDGLGNLSCLYLFAGRDYEINILYSDLWRLCPVSGFLGTSAETTFEWTELLPMGTLPGGRSGDRCLVYLYIQATATPKNMVVQKLRFHIQVLSKLQNAAKCHFHA